MTQAPAKRLTAEERRQAVLDTACRVFSRTSYRGATTAEIAREAGHLGADPLPALRLEARPVSRVPRRGVASFRAICEEAIAGDPEKSLGAIADAYMVRGRKIRVIDLWIQALNEASEDKVIAAAVRRQVREVHDFFADVIRDGQRRGIIHADRDPVAEAWIFVAGGLLATIDGRLGGLLGDDLLAVRASRRRWMMAAPVSTFSVCSSNVRKPRLRHPGLSLVRRGAGWACPDAALRPRRVGCMPPCAPPPTPDASSLGARCAHCTSLSQSVK